MIQWKFQWIKILTPKFWPFPKFLQDTTNTNPMKCEIIPTKLIEIYYLNIFLYVQVLYLHASKTCSYKYQTWLTKPIAETKMSCDVEMHLKVCIRCKTVLWHFVRCQTTWLLRLKYLWMIKNIWTIVFWKKNIKW